MTQPNGQKESGAASPQPLREQPPRRVDVAIIGAGLAGTSAAAILARSGHSVALVDSHAVVPQEFRAEKLGAPHMDMFARLGLGPAVAGSVTPTEDVHVYRFGRLFSHRRGREYGFSYASLVNGLRQALPPAMKVTVGHVDTIATGPERQHIGLADGTAIDARLLVVATGLGDTVRRMIGVRRVEDVKCHSLALGFNLAGSAADYLFDNLTYYPSDRRQRAAYASLFRIGDTIRVNLFVYRTPGEAWTKAFFRDPQPMLCAMMPEIAKVCRGFGVAGGVKVRPIDLFSTEGYRRDGVVLVGDAFRTTCPVPGVGIRRAMTDVGRLCTDFVPRWLATPGMGADKISAYYDDPAKAAMDAQAMRSSIYAREIVVGRGAIWTARRLRNDTARRCLLHIGAVRASLRRGPESTSGRLAPE